MSSILYKYRGFSVNTLRMLSEAEVYYAPPSSFNDPLDCNPNVESDLETLGMENLCKFWLEERFGADAAGKRIRGHRYAVIEYGAWNDDGVGESYYRWTLKRMIEESLFAEFSEHGILSLSESYESPLMWSHYGAEHRGLCIAYDSVDTGCQMLKPVTYGEERNISAADLAEWKLAGSAEHREKAFHTFFYHKASDWSYEREWRDITKKGATSSRMDVTALYFGLRCDPAIVTTIVKLAENTHLRVPFFAMRPNDSSFKLAPVEIDLDEIRAVGVKAPLFREFEDIDDDYETP